MDDGGCAVLAEGVVKRYRGRGQAPALDGFDLRVPQGTVYGLLGPNGAGKTTAVRVFTTLTRFDAGRVVVAGHDVRREGDRVRARIGLVGQHAALDEALSGRQNLELFGRLHHLGAGPARRRAGDLLARSGLGPAADRPVRTYSGGMRRRLDLAAGLLVAPDVLFVDEPTTGLDPAGRRDVWDAVTELAGAGTTVLLTTQYLEEADRLAHRIAMMRAGRVVAEGTPRQLKAGSGGDRIELVVRDGGELARARTLLGPLAAGPVETLDAELRLRVPVADGARSMVGVVSALAGQGIEPVDLALGRPTLDGVFLQIVGRS